MKKAWNLFVFEQERLLKLLWPTLLGAFVLEFLIFFISAFNYNREIKQLLAIHPEYGASDVLNQVGGFGLLRVINQPLFLFPLMGISLFFIFYAIFNLYREWFGKDTFIYRLLMLPISRVHLYLSKVFVFLTGGLTALMSQLLIFMSFQKLSEFLVEPDYLEHYSLQQLIANHPLLSLFYKTNWIKSVEFFLFALSFLAMIYLIILLERSYRLKGLVAGLVITILSFAIFIILTSRNLFFAVFHVNLLPSEFLILTFSLELIGFVLSSIINVYLLTHKVTV